jgi:hypothetical protein
MFEDHENVIRVSGDFIKFLWEPQKFERGDIFTPNNQKVNNFFPCLRTYFIRCVFHTVRIPTTATTQIMTIPAMILLSGFFQPVKKQILPTHPQYKMKMPLRARKPVNTKLMIVKRRSCRKNPRFSSTWNKIRITRNAKSHSEGFVNSDIKTLVKELV